MGIITAMPLGYTITVLLLAYSTWQALSPAHLRKGFSTINFYFGCVINEIPFVALICLFLSTFLAFNEGDIYSFMGWITFGVAISTALGIVVIIRRSLLANKKVLQALDGGLEKNWQKKIDAKLISRLHSRFHLSAVLGPFFRRRWNVKHIADISYGDAGRSNFLDIYINRSRSVNAPVLIHFHGGAMVTGKKNREALPLLYHLASKGWVCISANYRLQPVAKFPAQLVDVKKVIAWVRKNCVEYGFDASAVFVAGGSAGGQLACQAALTQNDPKFQPGFEKTNTFVTAAISLYGYYGWFNENYLQQLNSIKNIPPIFVVHGDIDTLTPVEGARNLINGLRKISRNAIVYAELPGAQHNFDLFHSIRSEVVIYSIEAFAAWVMKEKSFKIL